MNLLELFYTFFKIGMISIGGGYAILPIIQFQIVDSLKLITIEQYIHIITISQMTPGPLVVNTASFVGLQISGVMGAIVATLGSVISGVFLSIVLYKFFMKYRSLKSINHVLLGLRSTSIGLIAASAVTILMLSFYSNNQFSFTSLSLFVLSYILSMKIKKPLMVIFISGLLGIITYS